jgi:DNA-directed RNA polymerase subunit omega
MPVLPRNTLMNPPIEDLLDKVDSKFTLVALSSKRARQINSYYNQLGEGLGVVVPPQVTSVSGKPLTIDFEEISAGKATFHRLEPGEGDETEGVADLEALTGVLDVTGVSGAGADGGAVAEIADVDILAVPDAGVADLADAEVADVEVVASADDLPELPADQ